MLLGRPMLRCKYVKTYSEAGYEIKKNYSEYRWIAGFIFSGLIIKTEAIKINYLNRQSPQTSHGSSFSFHDHVAILTYF